MAEGKDQRGLTLPYLKAWRLERAVTQDELSKQSGVGRTTIIRAEAGEPVSIPNVRKLADALGITVRQLRHEDPGASKAKGAA